jgi:hypothetical protein
MDNGVKWVRDRIGNKGRPRKETVRVRDEPVVRVVQEGVRGERLGKDGKKRKSERPNVSRYGS